jgi:hypothetical protein
MIKKTFSYSLLILIFYLAISYILIVQFNYDDEKIYGLVTAAILAFLNVLTAIIFISKNLTKNDREFVKSFVLSLSVRLVILLAIFFTIVLKMPVNHFVFSTGFIILYFLFQIVEIYVLHTNKSTGNES